MAGAACRGAPVLAASAANILIVALSWRALAFPDMMPKARVQEIMARLMGQGDDDDNDTARFDAFRHSVKQGQSR